MTKRFSDGDIWQKDWFLNLDDKQKLLTKFIFDNCDCAGVYEISWRMLKIFFTSDITREDFEKIKQVRFLDDNTIFVEDFVNFQCSISSINELNPNNNAHKGIIKRLKKYGLYLGANEGLNRGSIAPQEKEKEKEKEKEININSYNPNNIFNPIVKEFQKQMKEVLHNAIRLSIEQSNKVVELNQRVPDFIKTIPFVFERLKTIQWNFNGRIVSPDVNWLLEKENYISVLNGKFTTKQQIIQEKLRRKEQENERG